MSGGKKFTCSCVRSPCSSSHDNPSTPNTTRSWWASFLLRKNTMTPDLKVRVQSATSSADRSASLPARTRTNSCTKPRATLRLGSTNSRTGLFRDILMSSSTESVIVAEKSIVCLETGQALIISPSSSAKPSDSILSASSRTRTSSASSANVGELRRWSIRRPGVAMTTSGRAFRATSCDLSDSPPVEPG